MSVNEYMEQIYMSLDMHKANALKQYGKSDLDSPDYKQNVEEWYSQIIDLVNENPPEEYVRSINIYQNSSQYVERISYDYCDKKDFVRCISLGIIWI